MTMTGVTWYVVVVRLTELVALTRHSPVDSPVAESRKAIRAVPLDGLPAVSQELVANPDD
jgi:hypothetical protein